VSNQRTVSVCTTTQDGPLGHLSVKTVSCANVTTVTGTVWETHASRFVKIINSLVTITLVSTGTASVMELQIVLMRVTRRAKLADRRNAMTINIPVIVDSDVTTSHKSVTEFLTVLTLSMK
jgi:dUTPase